MFGASHLPPPESPSQELSLVGPFDRNQDLAAELSGVPPVATGTGIGREAQVGLVHVGVHSMSLPDKQIRLWSGAKPLLLVLFYQQPCPLFFLGVGCCSSTHRLALSRTGVSTSLRRWMTSHRLVDFPSHCPEQITSVEPGGVQPEMGKTGRWNSRVFG